MMKYKNKIFAVVLLIAAVAIAFFTNGQEYEPEDKRENKVQSVETVPEEANGNTEKPDFGIVYTPEKRDTKIKDMDNGDTKTMQTPQPVHENNENTSLKEENKPEERNVQIEEHGSLEYSEANGMVFDEETGLDKYQTEPVEEGRPVPVEPQDAVITDNKKYCTLFVGCETILLNMDKLKSEKHYLVPDDGVIFPETQIVFYEGESVFNVLQREMKRAKIHMEFSKSPIYNSAYIEGINNLYEYDCGSTSGWVYCVNDWFPNYGCSRYSLEEGDRIEVLYTCNLGEDVGKYIGTTHN